ncbi:MAG: ComEC/Rec2 family competence protein, partial [Campylobacterales bacterium]|nr:ComEC/Rec2 family competence protein [Campylobacterales bacterium]
MLHETSKKYYLYKEITSVHEDLFVKDLYSALFLATEPSKYTRDISQLYGIAHIIAISGFHLAFISFFIYWIFYFPYKFLQDRFFPYRNRNEDLLIISSIFIFFYLYFIDFIPSFLRAVILFLIVTYFYFRSIKILSIYTLLIVILISLALFPQYVINVGFWFSVFGVFYIYLFLNYFKHLSNVKIAIFLNIFLFFSMIPIVHYIFNVISIYQFSSIFFTIIFPIFYPISIVAHIIGFGDIFDNYLIKIFSLHVDSSIIQINIYFLLFYILLSIIAYFNKKAFYLFLALMSSF